MPVCRDCHHVAVANEVDGFCHRFPPTVISGGDTISSAWPVVNLDKGYCGEFDSAKFIPAPPAPGDA